MENWGLKLLIVKVERHSRLYVIEPVANLLDNLLTKTLCRVLENAASFLSLKTERKHGSASVQCPDALAVAAVEQAIWLALRAEDCS